MNPPTLIGALVAVVLLSGPTRADDPPKAADPAAHWAWKTPVRPSLPHVRDGLWVRTPIDGFILARLEAAGLRPAAEVSREVWIRRVTFDLTGLPPTPAEIDAFLADRSADAYEAVVDRLLADPGYGERWGRHWLDLARFAETNGYEHDEVRPDAWRYRDYVVRAFNADKPYDRFVREQLAGDELGADDPEARTATAFTLLGPEMTDASSQRQRRQNTLDDMTDTAGFVFLGMSVACARCHNHKFEPISIHDYYRLQAFFTPADFRRDLVVADAGQRGSHARQRQVYDALTGPTRAALEAIETPHRDRLYKARLAKLPELARIAHETPEDQRTGAQRELYLSTLRFLVIPPKELLAALSPTDRAAQERLLAELKKFDSKKPAPLPTAMGLAETGKTAKTFVLMRGELSNPGDEVLPGFPSILAPEAEPATIAPPSSQTSGRRTALADWVTNPDNPLTARVMVNRLWQHHFGRGIVASASDFGVRGERPTHPELLDWLAREFVESGWSLKRMHRMLLLSATYRQSTTADRETAAKDPLNHLLGRMNRMRLEAEAVRDGLLAVSDRLQRKMGGPGVVLPMPPELAGAKDKANASPAEHARRSVYLFARRNLRLPFLEPFDLPDSNLSCPQRERSTTAPQALALLNAADVAAASKALAGRLERDGSSSEERIALAYRLMLGRRPTTSERQMCVDFLRAAPLSELCRALFNVNEFVYLD